MDEFKSNGTSEPEPVGSISKYSTYMGVLKMFTSNSGNGEGKEPKQMTDKT